MNGKINDVELSCQGIDMLVNNDLDGCESLFIKHKDASPLMNYCASFISLMRAVMSFEEQALEKASSDLETTIKLCSSSNKVFSSLKKAFSFSKSSNSSSLSSFNLLQQQFASSNTLEDTFTKQIIVADCKLYRGILTFISQDVGSYLNNGILQLRSSWKMYARLQKQLFDLFKKLEPKAEQIYGIDEDSLIKNSLVFMDNDDKNNNNTIKNNNTASNVSGENDNDEDDENVQNALNNLNLNNNEEISLDTVKRLLGFESDRTAALKAISFTSRSKDMRAPFADMMLLWYETVAKQLFNLSEADVSIGTNEEIEQILNKNLEKYPRSSLFLYYKGRYYRSIIRDLNKAQDCFKQAFECATKTRELQLIAVYELGWLHIMNLNYEEALTCFKRLSEESKWSNSYHKYVCALLYGCLNKLKEANQCVKDAISSSKQKNNPIEQFALKRLEFLKKNPIKSNSICEFMCIELCFLWVCIPYCESAKLKKMLQICDSQIEKHLYPIKCLFEGAIHVQLEDYEFGKQCFEESIARSENEKQIPVTKYALPFAYHQLALVEMNSKNYEISKKYLEKAKDNFKDYDFENRLVPQLRSAQRKLKYLLDKNTNNLNSSSKQDIQQQTTLTTIANDKSYALNNFMFNFLDTYTFILILNLKWIF